MKHPIGHIHPCLWATRPLSIYVNKWNVSGIPRPRSERCPRCCSGPQLSDSVIDSRTDAYFHFRWRRIAAHFAVWRVYDDSLSKLDPSSEPCRLRAHIVTVPLLMKKAIYGRWLFTIQDSQLTNVYRNECRHRRLPCYCIESYTQRLKNPDMHRWPSPSFKINSRLNKRSRSRRGRRVK